MKNLLLLILGILILGSCQKDLSIDTLQHSESVFGVEFDKNQDWCTTIKDKVTLTGLNAKKVTVMALIDDQLQILNVADYYDGITIYYDAPKESQVFVMYTTPEGKQYFIDYSKSNTRGTRVIDIPTTPPAITGTVESYEKQRGYPGFENEVLYTTNLSPIKVDGYSDFFTQLFQATVFTYLPNGKGYDNLPQILASGYYNNDCYAVTTGEEPIVVSLVFKNDGGYHEVETGELYYYYFKGDITVDQIKALPKYKALDVSTTMSADGVINKNYSYVLAYFDGETPSYQFPKGYNIGFMLRMNYKDAVKKGELYFDGRLNTKINNHGHFKSSKLGATDPRMCWLSVNDVMLMCCEAGTDRDFNDAVFEIEGGVEPIIIPIDPKYNFYTFCYEDQHLGDYDMNDVVLKGERLDETHVRYTLMACGATDDLYLYNINGTIINKNSEVHSILNKPSGTFVNTTKGDKTTYVTDIITVNKTFSFLDADTQPYIYDATKGWEVKVARKGQDPHAIMVPYDFRWPLEKVCIKDAYKQFNTWGQNLIESINWYLYPEEDKIW